MSRALEHSPIRHSKTVPRLGIFGDVRCGLLKGEQIVLVALFGTTSRRVLRFLVHHGQFNFGTPPLVPTAIFTLLALALRCAAFHAMARAHNRVARSPKRPARLSNKEGLLEPFPMGGICGRC
jgi:hypothetical protein